MEKSKIVLIVIIAFVLTFFCIAIYVFSDITTKQSTWRTKYVEGQIKELKLITTFPDEGCLVCFTDGNFTFVDTNYYWTYAQLSVIQSWNKVNITYEINENSNVRVLHIQEIPIYG